jgi:hypothetical protein
MLPEGVTVLVATAVFVTVFVGVAVLDGVFVNVAVAVPVDVLVGDTGVVVAV